MTDDTKCQHLNAINNLIMLRNGVIKGSNGRGMSGEELLYMEKLMENFSTYLRFETLLYNVQYRKLKAEESQSNTGPSGGSENNSRSEV